MKRRITLTYLREIVMVLAVVAVITYFLHVLLGTLAYPGYDAIRQPVSDLTAEGAPSQGIARLYTNLYGVFTSIVSIILIIKTKNISSHILKIGIISISLMYIISAIGYGLFPLDQDTNTMSFQNMMHIVVTIAVVLLTIGSLIIFMIAMYKLKFKGYFIVTLFTFMLMMIGAVMTNIVSESYLGLFERFSVFSVVLYHLFVPYLLLKHPQI